MHWHLADKASKKDDEEMEKMTALLTAAKNGVVEMVKKGSEHCSNGHPRDYIASGSS